MNEPSGNNEVSMLRVWQSTYRHVQECGIGECCMCALFEELAADPRRPEWEQAEREAQAEAEYQRQAQVNERKEFQDD